MVRLFEVRTLTIKSALVPARLVIHADRLFNACLNVRLPPLKSCSEACAVQACLFNVSQTRTVPAKSVPVPFKFCTVESTPLDMSFSRRVSFEPSQGLSFWKFVPFMIGLKCF